MLRLILMWWNYCTIIYTNHITNELNLAGNSITELSVSQVLRKRQSVLMWFCCFPKTYGVQERDFGRCSFWAAYTYREVRLPSPANATLDIDEIALLNSRLHARACYIIGSTFREYLHRCQRVKSWEGTNWYRCDDIVVQWPTHDVSMRLHYWIVVYIHMHVTSYVQLSENTYIDARESSPEKAPAGIDVMTLSFNGLHTTELFNQSALAGNCFTE